MMKPKTATEIKYGILLLYSISKATRKEWSSPRTASHWTEALIIEITLHKHNFTQNCS